VATARDADPDESRRDPGGAGRRVQPSRRPADDAELLDVECIRQLDHVARPVTKRAPREDVRPPNPGTVDGDQAHVRRGRDGFVGTKEPRVRRAVEQEDAAALRLAPLGVGEHTAVTESNCVVREWRHRLSQRNPFGRASYGIGLKL
jgi:hypothetical protein